jgi:hypothetical protein
VCRATGGAAAGSRTRADDRPPRRPTRVGSGAASAGSWSARGPGLHASSRNGRAASTRRGIRPLRQDVDRSRTPSARVRGRTGHARRRRHPLWRPRHVPRARRSGMRGEALGLQARMGPDAAPSGVNRAACPGGAIRRSRRGTQPTIRVPGRNRLPRASALSRRPGRHRAGPAIRPARRSPGARPTAAGGRGPRPPPPRRQSPEARSRPKRRRRAPAPES